jgi:hypothetical protein
MRKGLLSPALSSRGGEGEESVVAVLGRNGRGNVGEISAKGEGIIHR